MEDFDRWHDRQLVTGRAEHQACRNECYDLIDGRLVEAATLMQTIIAQSAPSEQVMEGCVGVAETANDVFQEECMIVVRKEVKEEYGVRREKLSKANASIFVLDQMYGTLMAHVKSFEVTQEGSSRVTLTAGEQNEYDYPYPSLGSCQSD